MGIVEKVLILLAGFAVMIAVGMAATVLLQRLAPKWVAKANEQPPLAFVLVTLGYSFVGAAAGGYVTTWAAEFNPLPYMLALAIIVLALGAMSAQRDREQQPMWFRLELLVVSPLGVLAGGLIRLKVMGFL